MIKTVISLVFSTKPNANWFSDTTTFCNLSMARGHCRKDKSGSPITLKNCLYYRCQAIFIAKTPTAAMRVSSIKILAGYWIWLPEPSKTPGFSLHFFADTALAAAPQGRSYLIMSMYYLCFLTKPGRFANLRVKPSIALRKGSQQEDNVFEPKTIANAKQKKLSIN